MKKQAVVAITAGLAAALAAVRIWNLQTGLDDSGLPISCPSRTVLLILAAAVLLVLIPIALHGPGTAGSYKALRSGSVSFSVSIAACVVFLIGAVVQFAEALTTGATISAPILCLLSLVGGFSGIIVAVVRRRGHLYPFFELLPMILQLIALIILFKSWSIDPILLDYLFPLLSMIFALLAIHAGAGFVFQMGRPRGALYASMAASVYTLTAAAGALYTGSSGEMLLYIGFFLWFLAQAGTLAS